MAVGVCACRYRNPEITNRNPENEGRTDDGETTEQMQLSCKTQTNACALVSARTYATTMYLDTEVGNER